MALQFGMTQTFGHSGEFGQGLGNVRPGQGTVVVAKDGTGDTDTITEALQILTTTTLGGLIYIKEGTYTEDITIPNSKVVLQGSGWATKIVGYIKNLSLNEVKILDLEIDATGKNNGIISGGFNNFTIKGCYIHGANDDGIYFGSGSKAIISNNNITANGNSGIYLTSSDAGIGEIPVGDLTGILVSNNFIYSNSSNGIRIESATSHFTYYITIVGNIIRDNGTREVWVRYAECYETIITSNNLAGTATNSIVDAGTSTLKDIGGVSLNIL